jgi:hypothetical protein
LLTMKAFMPVLGCTPVRDIIVVSEQIKAKK